MAVKFLDLHKQYLSIKEEIDSAIARVIEKSAFVGGEEVALFEREFSSYIGSVESLGVANGTDALEIALEALDLDKGKEVLIPVNTFIATAEAIVRNGLKAIFVDCGADYTLDIKDLESKITKDSVAIMAVHLYGQPARMGEILALAKKYDLKVIEDCAQAHGARYKGQRVGSFGDVATFSFYPGKNLGAYGDGGMIVSKNKELLKKCEKIAHHGGLKKYEHSIIGRNSRLDGIQAAILRVKLRYLDAWNARRREIAKMYFEGLKDSTFILPLVREENECVWHLFVARCKNREVVMKKLREADIDFGLHYPLALPNTEAFKDKGYTRFTQNPNASLWQDEILSLPMGEHLENSEVQEVIKILRSN